MSFNCLEFFKEETGDLDAEVRVGAISRLNLIASALGPQKTVSELIPFVTQAIQQAPLSTDDEFLYGLAKQMATLSGQFYIGGQDEVLVAPLEFLAAQEESLIRNEALSSLNHIVAGRTSLVPEHVVPVVYRLAMSGEFTARISACRLMPPVYQFAAEEQKAGLQELYFKLCVDDTPMVRRAAADKLGDLISVCPKQVVINEMIALCGQHIKEDGLDTIRIMGVPALLATARMLSQEENMEHTVPLIKDAAQDSSWRVRLAVAKSFDQVCSAFGMEIVSEELMVYFAKLMQDPEMEVRKEAARAVEPCLRLDRPPTSEQLQQHVLPQFKVLCIDTSDAVRAVIGQALGPLAGALGREATMRELLGVTLALMKDESFEVRAGIAPHSFSICEVLGSDTTVLLGGILDMMSDNHWRIRRMAIEQMPKLGRLFGVEVFQSKFESMYLSCLCDSVYAVRTAAVETLKDIVEVFGTEWTVEHLLPQLMDQNSQSTSYWHRLTMIHAVPQVSVVMTPEQITQLLIPVLIKGTKDVVPNVRFCACQNIRWMTLHHDLGVVAINTMIRPALLELEHDTDVDVTYFTQEAISGC